jgi:hypothetical protein
MVLEPDAAPRPLMLGVAAKECRGQSITLTIPPHQRIGKVSTRFAANNHAWHLPKLSASNAALVLTARPPIRASRLYRRSALPTFAYYGSGMWKAGLLRPIKLEDGRTLRTLADAHDVILQLPEKELRRPKWQALVSLLLSAAATRQHHLLSILTVRLEAELPRLAHTTEPIPPPKKPPAPSVKHRLQRRRKAKLLK